jgi:trans-L-3-hydroxyproline dehydratase
MTSRTYGAPLVEPDHPEADLAVLFMHNGVSATSAATPRSCAARWASRSAVARSAPRDAQLGDDRGLQCPCGLVTGQVAGDGTVRFVRASLRLRNRSHRAQPHLGPGGGRYELAHGGAFYAFLAADLIGLDLRSSPMRAIVDAEQRRSRGRPPRRSRSSIPTRPI